MIKFNLSIRDIAIIGLLVAISSITRIGMSYLPNIQISTALIILITLNYGLKYGLLVAILTPLTSNMILGQGLWTIWQMISWSIISIISISFKRYKNDTCMIGILALISGYIFGFTISIQSALTYGLYGNSFVVYYLTGVGFDTMHSIGNMIFCILMVRRFNLIVEKFRK